MYDSCIDGNYDAEELEACTVIIRKARKEHYCGECREKINPGEKYEYVKGVCDGYWMDAKTCWSCKIMRDSIFRTWIIGMVWETFQEEYGFSPFEVPTDEPKKPWSVP